MDKDKNNKMPPFLSARFIASAVFGLLLIIGVIITLVSSARLVNIVLEEYVLNIDECDNGQSGYPYYNIDEKDSAPELSEEEKLARCRDRELDHKKRDVANSVAFLLFSIPLAYLTYDRLRRLISV